MPDSVCPKCHSLRVKVFYPDIECLDCGWSEPLVDFPVSWNEHRRLCLEFGKPDPGIDIPPRHTVEELHERLAALEESAQAEKPELESRSEPKPRLSGGVKL